MHGVKISRARDSNSQPVELKASIGYFPLHHSPQNFNNKKLLLTVSENPLTWLPDYHN